MFTCSQGALRPLSPSYLHKILELLLMHLVSLSQSRSSASVLELCRSLEYEHEVRREVTLQVMRWFGEVDAADELWKMDVEKVVRQVGLGILRRHKVGVNVFHHPSSILTITPNTRFRATLYHRTSSWQSGMPPSVTLLFPTPTSNYSP